VLVPVICGDPAGRRSYAVIGVDGAYGGQRWRYDGPPVTVADPPDAELTMSPEQTAARYRPREPGAEPVLLYSFVDGVVLYRAPDTEIVAFDEVHVVLRRYLRGTDQLLLRSLVTRTERPLDSTCPALERSDGTSRVASVVTPRTEEFAGDVLVLCFEDREGAAPRADIDVYASDGTRRTTVEVAVSAVPPELLVAPGAVVLVEHRDSGPDVLVGLA
jgi:hypothetical protein